jgi:hypothetical protein
MDIYARLSCRLQYNRLWVRLQLRTLLAEKKLSGDTEQGHYLRYWFKANLLDHELRTDIDTAAKFKSLAQDLVNEDDLDLDKVRALLLGADVDENGEWEEKEKTTNLTEEHLECDGPWDDTLRTWWRGGSSELDPRWMNSRPTGREVINGSGTTALLAWTYIHRNRYYCAHDAIRYIIHRMWEDGLVKNVKDALALLLTMVDLHCAPWTVPLTYKLLDDGAMMVAYVIGYRGDNATKGFTQCYNLVHGPRRVIGTAVLKWYRDKKEREKRDTAARIIQERVIVYLYRPEGRIVRRKGNDFKAVAAGP